MKATRTIRTNPDISYYRLARQLGVSESRVESLLVTLTDWYPELWQDDANKLYAGYTPELEVKHEVHHRGLLTEGTVAKEDGRARCRTPSVVS